MVRTVLVSSIETVLLEFLRHWREGDTFWKIGEWIDEASLLLGVVEEGAAFTELALAGVNPILARNRLVVRVNRTEGCLAEILGKRLLHKKIHQSMLIGNS